MATPAQLEVNRLRNEIEETQENIQVFQERLQDPNLTALQRGGTQRNLDRATARLAELQTELVAAEAAVASEPAPQPPPPATAAETVKDDAPSGPTATPEQTVGTNGRVTDVPPNTAPTNAAVQPTGENPEGVTSGTDAPVKTTEQTQAITTDSNSGQATPVPVAPTAAEPAAA